MTNEMKSSQYPEADDFARWQEFFELVTTIAVPEEFLGNRGGHAAPETRPRHLIHFPLRTIESLSPLHLLSGS